MDDRKHNYVVGFEGNNQCIYGRGAGENNLDPMTLFQAKRQVRTLGQSRGVKRTIYKLVPVECID